MCMKSGDPEPWKNVDGDEDGVDDLHDGSGLLVQQTSNHRK